MPGEAWAKKLLPKMQNRFIVDIFCLAGLDRLVWGKWLTVQMWAHYINKKHPILYAYLFDAVMLHHVSYALRS